MPKKNHSRWHDDDINRLIQAVSCVLPRIRLAPDAETLLCVAHGSAMQIKVDLCGRHGVDPKTNLPVFDTAKTRGVLSRTSLVGFIRWPMPPVKLTKVRSILRSGRSMNSLRTTPVPIHRSCKSHGSIYVADMESSCCLMSVLKVV